MRYFSNLKIILALIVIILLVIVLISACDIGGGRGTPSAPATTGILAPPSGAKVLLGGPVQIQSAFSNAADISRVELWVQKPDNERDLLRSDVPDGGVVLQEWRPRQVGKYTVELMAHLKTQSAPVVLTRTIEVTTSAYISLPAEAAGAPAEVAFQPPTPTPVVNIVPTEIGTTPQAGQAAEATPTVPVIVLVATVTPEPSPTPIRHFPPPPPAPGVPPGPIQDKLPKLAPPVCDAAEFVRVFDSPRGERRIFVNTPDDVPAKAVGGTTVHRAWVLRNTGTCTWGPGYELAFYGGRAMGSGGVAFEVFFPNEPPRRNIVVDTNRLVAPEGKPNEEAVLEVLLNVPPIPGIHQSYWRMRNPQGVYFGPIVGVTLDVVRGCQFGDAGQQVFGGPTVEKFEILGYGNVFRPENPVEIQVQRGEPVIVEWSILNADSFDIVLEDPTGVITTLSNTDPNARASFRPTALGKHTITIYADNGPCTGATAFVTIDVIPPLNEQFELDLILSSQGAASSSDPQVSFSSTLTSGNVIADWRHFDQATDHFELIAQLYKRTFSLQCPFIDSIFGWRGYCSKAWGDWQAVAGKRTVITVGGAGDAQGAATVANVEKDLCPDPASFDPTKEDYGIQYVMRAEKQGRAAQPEFSNTVDTRCGTTPSTSLPVEIESRGFNPDQ